MNANRFTEKLQEAIGSAQSAAVSAHHQAVDVEHLAAALIADQEGLAASILKLAGADLNQVRSGWLTNCARFQLSLEAAPTPARPMSLSGSTAFLPAPNKKQAS